MLLISYRHAAHVVNRSLYGGDEVHVLILFELQSDFIEFEIERSFRFGAQGVAEVQGDLTISHKKYN